ncbi:MAG: DUF4402 domain-containing protein [Alphaproteobacteria bacterium]
MIKKDMVFCDTAPDPIGGTIQKNPTDTKCINISGASSFPVSGTIGKVVLKKGTANAAVDLMFTSNGPLIGPGASLVMHSITSDSGATSGMLNGIGKLVLKLGAQLDLNPLQASGIYTGNYTFSWKETTNPTWSSIVLPVDILIMPLNITIAETAPMHFGAIIADPAGGNIQLDTLDGVSNITGTSILIGTPTSAKFDLRGEANAAFTIDFPTRIFLTGPGTDMRVNNFTHDAPVTPSFSAAGEASFSAGGLLRVNAIQTMGAYSGTYTITISY